MNDGNPFQPPQTEPYPGIPWAANTDFKLLCDYCQQEITQTETAINLLLGQVVLGKRNMSPMVGPSPHYPKGDTTLHFECLSMLIVEDMPWVADEIIELVNARNIDDPETFDVEESLCSACGTPFDG